ncbi:serine/threonine-protein kinase [Nocardia bhagyanarayanae]|uniref:non-specific serine/threonine protein kinase n=1 Tax=Nocardia bhagyanarayanae TaxID=1215925 RepID=A0A543FER5_9NOCA|nr:serine/threonine-protein kinase [Nocardia bhagyanarayanae]TQM32252.1 serine/threonine-protein kinase [Nocardia bhagyanarayanae]
MTETWPPGTVVAGYRIERTLGGGGMGTVYLAAHPRLPRYDALKVLAEEHGGDPEFRARFVREADLVARLDHPNIVAVRDRGAERGFLWLAMQFVDGIDVAELLRRNPGGVEPGVALHILTETARGLDEAHRAGLLHRDVKPANILLEPRPGEPDRVYVTDFGIARAVADTTALTEVGAVLATLAYAAPEQISAAALDHRVDVYALGCTLYELLTGTKPFVRDNAVAVMHAHLHEPPPRVTALRPLPPAVDEVIARAMAKDPALRYPSCGALAQAASAALAADAPPLPASTGGAPRRRRGAVIVGAVVVLALVVASLAALGWNRETGDSAATGPSTTASTTKAPSTQANSGPISWGPYGVIVSAFPALLPATPISGGHQGMRCVPVDRDLRQIDLAARPEAVLRLSCQGNQDPLDTLTAVCNANLNPAQLRPFSDIALVGDERWERPSGRGRLVWGDSRPPDGRPSGSLQIQFDDPARNFCQLVVSGGATGRELVDRWWRDAPL